MDTTFLVFLLCLERSGFKNSICVAVSHLLCSLVIVLADRIVARAAIFIFNLAWDLWIAVLCITVITSRWARSDTLIARPTPSARGRLFHSSLHILGVILIGRRSFFLFSVSLMILGNGNESTLSRVWGWILVYFKGHLIVWGLFIWAIGRVFLILTQIWASLRLNSWNVLPKRLIIVALPLLVRAILMVLGHLPLLNIEVFVLTDVSLAIRFKFIYFPHFFFTRANSLILKRSILAIYLLVSNPTRRLLSLLLLCRIIITLFCRL